MRNLTIIIIAFSCFILLASVNALAFEDQESFDLLPENSFILSPTKIEILLDPGESTIKDLLIVNRLGRAGNFKVEIEDCQGSSIGEQPVVLLGEKRGPYPLKDYLKPQFTGRGSPYSMRRVWFCPLRFLCQRAWSQEGFMAQSLLVGRLLKMLRKEMFR